MASAVEDGATRRFRLLLTLCSALLIGCGRSEGVSDYSRLFDRTFQDLGGIRVDSEYEATYQLVNSTSRAVAIADIKTSCGCIATAYDKSPIPPGGRRDITLSLKTHGLSVMGPMVKHAVVEFEADQKVHLQLKARLASDFNIDPRRVEFSADQRSHRIALTRGQLEPDAFSKLVLVANPDRYHVTEVSKGNVDRREFMVAMKEASADATLPEIYFSTSVDGRPLPFATITCVRTGPTILPSTFVVVTAASGPLPAPQNFKLQDFQSQPMRIKAVAGLDEESQRLLSVKFDPGVDAKSFSVSLAQMPDQQFTNLFVAVDFASLDAASTGRLLLPCSIIRRPAAN